MMKAINREYYGDDLRWFVATVIDSSPPRGLEGRIKIRIHGIHSPDVNDIPQRDLPWAQVLMPGDTYGVSGLGSSCHILPGAIVFGMFLDGTSSQLPLVFGSMPRVEYPTTAQADGRQDPSTNPFSYKFEQSNAQMVDPSVGGEATVVGDVVAFFIDNGMNIKQAVSMSSILTEISGLDPNYDTHGFGIAGWYGHRYKRFFSFASRLSPKRSPSDMEAQLMFVMQELRTTHTLAMSKLLRCDSIKGSLVGRKIDGIQDAGNGMMAILRKYYAPKHIGVEINDDAASKKAEKLLESMGAR